MKQKKLYTLLCIGALMLSGCQDKDANETKNEASEKWKQTEALLLHVDKYIEPWDHRNHQYTTAQLYFDTDGNPETAEAMLILTGKSNKKALNIFNNAKIGTYKTLQEWEETLCEKYDYKEWIRSEKKQNIPQTQKTRE